jgi:NADH-quinone oxidoreductase subunit N
LLVSGLLALVQTKVKRFLAYSVIFNNVFFMVTVYCNNWDSYKAFIIFLVVYSTITFGLWGIIMNLRFFSSGREINTWRDLLTLRKSNAAISFSFIILFLSLAGIPPLAGFLAKFFVLKGLVAENAIFLSIFLLLASSLSAYYYLKIIKMVFFDEQNQRYAFYKPIRKVPAYLISLSVTFNLFLLLNPFVLFGWYWT